MIYAEAEKQIIDNNNGNNCKQEADLCGYFKLHFADHQYFSISLTLIIVVAFHLKITTNHFECELK